MGRLKSKHTIEVSENVYIKQIGDSKIWHYYFTVNGIQFRKSAKTKDKTKASQLALNEYHDTLDKKRSGKIVEKVSFRKLAQKYLESIKEQGKYKYHSETLQRHFMDFFGKIDDISKINSGKLTDYLIYRRTKSAVKNQTLNRENGVLNQIFQLGADYGWCSKDLRAKFQSETESRTRRKHFTNAEYDKLIEASRRRAHEYSKAALTAKERGLLTNKHWQRNLLHDLIIVFANTGLRVDEMKTVTWRDIDWTEKTIMLRHAGKTKSSRIVMVRGYGIRALERIKERRLAYLAKNDRQLKDSERIQSLPNGLFVNSFKKGFSELLNECGFEHGEDGERYTLTSLRHTYATLRLTAKKGSRASMRALAKQMGTSVRMLERHYGHDVVEDYRDELMG